MAGSYDGSSSEARMAKMREAMKSAEPEFEQIHSQGGRISIIQRILRIFSPNVEIHRQDVTRSGWVGNIFGSGNTINVVMNDRPYDERHLNRSSSRGLSGEQKARLYGLVQLISEAEKARKTRPRDQRAIWIALNSSFDVTSYGDIPALRFHEAEAFLAGQLRQLRRPLPASGGTEWRKKRYQAIYAQARNTISGRPSLKALKRAYNITSLKSLTDDDLEAVYEASRSWI